jgi:hypothetical protein
VEDEAMQRCEIIGAADERRSWRRHDANRSSDDQTWLPPCLTNVESSRSLAHHSNIGQRGRVASYALARAACGDVAHAALCCAR